MELTLDNKYLIEPSRPPKMLYCSKCVYPKSSAVPLAFDEKGECSGCKAADQRVDIDWDRRRKMFLEMNKRFFHQTVETTQETEGPVNTGRDLGFDPKTGLRVSVRSVASVG